MQNGTAILEDSVTDFYETKHAVATQSSNRISNYLTDLKTMSKQKLLVNVYGSFICNHQKLEATQMSVAM
jgi:hypothetical protein